MKVLVGIPCLLTGGTEVQTLSLVEALVAAGHQPIVACYFEYADVMVRRYRDAGATVELMSPDGKRPVGVKATLCHLWRESKRIVKAHRPDVAHIQYMSPGALPIIILRLLGVKKIIATSHTDGDIYSNNGLRVIRFLTNNILTAFQCITERAERSYFGSSRLFDGKLSRHFTIYNNIPSHIRIRQEPRRPKSGNAPFVVGVVSRLEPIKGMDLVVPAFALAAKKNLRLKLLIVGDGSQRLLMEQQVEEAGIADRVTFVGRQPQSALQDYYDQIDILLLPSRSEGFGLTAIEGMARGCVPIVANVGGLPEVVTPDCGLIHSSEDITDLADKITSITNDICQQNRLSNAAIKCAGKFSFEAYNNIIKRLYSQI